MPDLQSLIPHRPPFLRLDEIVELAETAIAARPTLRPDDGLWSRVYAGHYPGNPITPGALLCEIVFQAGAALMAHRLSAGSGSPDTASGIALPSAPRAPQSPAGIPVITRIRDAKFKQMVRPGDTLEISAAFDEQVSNAYYLHGAVKVRGQLAVRVEFTCARVAAP